MCRGENGATPPHGISISSTFFHFRNSEHVTFCQIQNNGAKRIEGEVVMSSTSSIYIPREIYDKHTIHALNIRTVHLIEGHNISRSNQKKKTHKTIFPTFRFE